MSRGDLGGGGGVVQMHDYNVEHVQYWVNTKKIFKKFFFKVKRRGLWHIYACATQNAFPTLVATWFYVRWTAHTTCPKVSKKNSSSIFYDNCVGHFIFIFFGPPMTSTKCSPQLNGNTIFTFAIYPNCVPILLHTPLCVPNGFHVFLNMSSTSSIGE